MKQRRQHHMHLDPFSPFVPLPTSLFAFFLQSFFLFELYASLGFDLFAIFTFQDAPLCYMQLQTDFFYTIIGWRVGCEKQKNMKVINISLTPYGTTHAYIFDWVYYTISVYFSLRQRLTSLLSKQSIIIWKCA